MYRLLKKSSWAGWTPVIEDGEWFLFDSEEEARNIVHELENDPDHAGEKYDYDYVSEEKADENVRKAAAIHFLGEW